MYVYVICILDIYIYISAWLSTFHTYQPMAPVGSMTDIVLWFSAACRHVVSCVFVVPETRFEQELFMVEQTVAMFFWEFVQAKILMGDIDLHTVLAV